MAKKTEKEIDQQIKYIRWFQWQCLRRNPQCRDAVENLITTARKNAKSKLRSPSTSLDQLTKKEHQSISKQWDKRDAYSKIVETYCFVSALYRRFIDKHNQGKDNNRDKIRLCNTNLEYCAKEAIFACLQTMPLIKGKRQSR